MSYRPITDTIFCARSKTKDPATGKSYYGAYPAGFLEKARTILGCSDSDCIWHVCGGMAKHYNGIKGGVKLSGFGKNDITIDIDPQCRPDILGDVRHIGESIKVYRDKEWYNPPDVYLYHKHFQIATYPRLGYSSAISSEFTAKSDHDIFYKGPLSIIIDRPYTLEDADHYRCGREVLPDLNKLLKDCLALIPEGGSVGVLDYMIPSSSNGKCIGVYPVIAGTNCRIRCFSVWQKLPFHLMEKTKNLDWLLLTKRAKNAKRFMDVWNYSPVQVERNKNVWIGVSVENQSEADERIPVLLQIPTEKRFLSIEPLLEKIDLTNLPVPLDIDQRGFHISCLQRSDDRFYNVHPVIDWVIVGGESGPKARPMHPEWVRSIRDQCTEAGVPFFFKQWGEWIESKCSPNGLTLYDKPYRLIRTAKFDSPLHSEYYYRVGKKKSGRVLDGREWNEFPKNANEEDAK